MGGSKSEVVSEICGDDEFISAYIEDESASQELLHKIVDLWITHVGFQVLDHTWRTTRIH